MNEKCIPLTKFPCKDSFKIFLKNRNVVYDEEQKKFLWRIWCIAWVFGKQYGTIKERQRHHVPLLTSEQMKKLWDTSYPMTGREFGKRIELHYGLRSSIHD
jgi:hypothetical protein